MWFLICICRYVEGSTKEATRRSRDKGVSRVYTLGSITRLPPQKLILTVTKNKMQLIDLIVADLTAHKTDFQTHTLVIVGSDPVPVEIMKGCVCKRHDLTTTHEEADTIIIQQVARVETGTVLVIADDTDIFVLLLHFCHLGNISCNVLMVSPIQGRAVLDINASVEKHRAVLPDLLAGHCLSGCDTVASHFGIGKGIALKVLRSATYRLDLLGNTGDQVQLSNIVEQATQFMLACYGQSSCKSMTEARKKLWSSKVGRSNASAPKLCSLPPTTEAFAENVARAHLQLAIWKSALEPTPPVLDPTAHGWSLKEGSTTLSPTAVPPETPLAPLDLLKLIRCSCQSQAPCKTQKCSCSSANIPCTLFCVCQGGHECQNERNKDVENAEDDD